MRYLILLCLCFSGCFGDRINPNVLSNFGDSNLMVEKKKPKNVEATQNPKEDYMQQIPAQSQTSKDEYLEKFYKVWNLRADEMGSKESVFYILPSLQSPIKYAKQLEELKHNPPKKNSKNYKAEQTKYKKQIEDLEHKINALLGVGENLLPNSLEEFQYIANNMNIESYMKRPQIAIITQATSIRVVPTDKPRYKNKNDFPFDRWQNSFLFEGTPVIITHFSKDGRFAHVRAPFVYGFVDSRNLAFVDDNLRRQILSFSDYKIPKEDFIPLKFRESFIMDARIGQIFPYNRRSNKLITFYKDLDNFAKIREIDFDSAKFSDFPMPFSSGGMLSIIDSMVGQKYGWGGAFGNRDCSAFTRDSFASFGIFLPRNSAAQAQFQQRFVDLSKQSDEDKEDYIIKYGIPYASIIWLRGHVMLYVGYEEINGKKVAKVAHSIWGLNPVVNNKKEKINLGGVKITTLQIDADTFSGHNIKNSLLSRVRGITNIYDRQSYGMK